MSTLAPKADIKAAHQHFTRPKNSLCCESYAHIRGASYFQSDCLPSRSPYIAVKFETARRKLIHYN